MLVSLLVYSFMNFRNRKTQYGFKFFVDIVSYKCVFFEMFIVFESSFIE